MKVAAPIILGYVAAAFAGNRLGNGEWVWAAIDCFTVVVALLIVARELWRS